MKNKNKKTKYKIGLILRHKAETFFAETKMGLVNKRSPIPWRSVSVECNILCGLYFSNSERTGLLYI
jgi:hypothetical protein